MLLRNVSNPIKTIVSILLISLLGSSIAKAQPLRCENNEQAKSYAQLCPAVFNTLRKDLNEKLLTTYLVSDAPLQLVNDTHQMWLNQTKQCKGNECLKQQFSTRIEDLNFYTSMNQTLTQHYLKFENGKIAKQPVHLKVHQLTKDRIKIEGLAYRNPNNRIDTQYVSLLAYTTPTKKHEILDNEHDCKYQLDFQKALLLVKTNQKGCERFTGIYRLYD